MEKLDYNLDFESKFKYSETSSTGLISLDTGKEVGNRDYKFKIPKAIRVEFKGKRYLVHRVIWKMLNGEISSDLEIDHVDGNPFNNKISNLRLVDASTNQRNRSKNANNITGEHGVCFHRTSTGSGGFNEYVRAVWTLTKGTQKRKDFNLKQFESFEDAVEFAALYREMMLSSDDSYSKSHGIRESKRKVINE